MRATVNLGDDLLAEARELTGVHSKTELARWALKALVEREAALWLAGIGGSAPDFEVPPRRRFAADLKTIP